MRLLVIRSVSFQQLDASLAAIRARFPGHAIDLLTHEHGRALAASCASVASVLVYPGHGPFRPGGWTPAAGLSWADVVVPVANVSGAGFANVFELARSLAPAVHRCNVAGEIVSLAPRALDRMRRADRMNRGIAAVAGPIVGTLAAGAFVAAAGLARLSRPERAARP